jgi:hypothetical protein
VEKLDHLFGGAGEKAHPLSDPKEWLLIYLD